MSESDWKRYQEAKAIAEELLNFVNQFGPDEEAFAATVASGHKTLQQSLMRLFIRTIREMSKVMPDDRNAQTVKLAKEIVEIAAKYYLPMI